MIKIKVAIAGLMLAAATGASADTGWRAANQAMGQAMQANDGKAAYRHSLEALRLYMKDGAPSEQTLVNLAINMADISMSWQTDMETSIREIKRVVTYLEGKGPGTA